MPQSRILHDSLSILYKRRPFEIAGLNPFRHISGSDWLMPKMKAKKA